MTRAAAIAAISTALMGMSQSAAHEKGLDARLRALAIAVIHGDLAGARVDADWIARREGVGTQLADPAAALKAAPDVAGAAAAVASLAAACGSCHRNAPVTPAVESGPPSPPGNIVAHMRGHQDAANLLLAGLVAPDGDAWVRGARQLEDAPLRHGEFPVSTRIGALMAGIETRLHAQATEAVAVIEPRARAGHYAAMLTTCSHCHARHTSLWQSPRP